MFCMCTNHWCYLILSSLEVALWYLTGEAIWWDWKCFDGLIGHLYYFLNEMSTQIFCSLVILLLSCKIWIYILEKNSLSNILYIVPIVLRLWVDFSISWLMLEEVIKRTWLPVDLWDGFKKPEAPPLSLEYAFSLPSQNYSCLKDTALR